jgi:hypothetical protein
MIVVSCAIGAYAIQNAMFDIWLMLGFGVVGYVFKKISIPLAPFTLALVLGTRAEDAFRLSMIGSGVDMMSVLVERSGRLDHDADHRAAVLAADRQGIRQRRAAVAAGEGFRLGETACLRPSAPDLQFAVRQYYHLLSGFLRILERGARPGIARRIRQAVASL